MLSVLLKKQLTEIFRNYFYNPKTNKARSKAAVAAYIVLFAVVMAVILGGMFTVLSAALCTPLTAAGLDWLYFALMALLATLWAPSAACSTPTPDCTWPRITICC